MTVEAHARRTPVRLRLSALSGVAASASAALLLFALFRFGVLVLGVDIVGCWALIQAGMMIARIADSGVPANITRMVAVKRFDEDLPVWEYLAAGAALSTLPAMLLGGLLIVPITAYVSHRFGAKVDLQGLRLLVWCAYLSGLCASLAGNALAIMEGLGRIFERNMLSAAAALSAIIVSWLLISRLGVVGFGLSAILFPALQLTAACACLGAFGPRATKFSLERALRTLAALRLTGLQLTLVGLLRLTFEPATKFALSWIGSLSAIAAFDLALKVATAMRILFQAAVQPLLAIGSRAEDKMSDDLRALFARAHGLILETSAAILALQLFGAPLVAWLGFGRITSEFSLFFVILAAANSANALGIVGYYSHLSAGRLRPLVSVHIDMVVINIVGGLVAAWRLGAVGAVLAYGVAMAYGGAISNAWWRRHSHQSLRRQLAVAFDGSALLLPVAFGFCLASPYLSTTLGLWPTLSTATIAAAATGAGALYKIRRYMAQSRFP